MKLSILIRTIPERLNKLRELLTVLYPQVNDEVEILISCDDRVKTRGKKCQEMITAATGDYLCFIDDDDSVPLYYVEEILKAVETKPDCVGIVGRLKDKMFVNSISVAECHEKDGCYFRPANHLNPVRKELALIAGFTESLDFSEDQDYGIRLKPLLKSEIMIKEVMYYYVPIYP